MQAGESERRRRSAKSALGCDFSRSTHHIAGIVPPAYRNPTFGAVAQARTSYGDGLAETILANISTRLVMCCHDGPTAKYFEEELDTQEVRRFVENRSMGSSTNSGESKQRLTQATVLASEIQGLPDLTGYLTAPASPIRKVKIEYQKMPETMPIFIPKAGV